MLQDFEVFPDEADPGKKLIQVRDWLKTVGVKDFDRISLDTISMSKDAVKLVETKFDQYLTTVGSSIRSVTVKGVPRDVCFAALSSPLDSHCVSTLMESFLTNSHNSGSFET